MGTLEDALAIAQSAQDSSQPHPLLWGKSHHGTEFEGETPEGQTDQSGPDDITTAFGTLHIDEKQKTMRFFGPSGGSEVSLYLTDRCS